MTKQLLIYNTAVPVSRAAHADAAIEPIPGYGFSNDVNSVPLMLVEFPQAAAEYVIVFAGQGEEVMPAVILGLRDHENLFLKADRQWAGRYIPAFLRRYPFVFSQNDDKLVLCIDEQYPGFNREGRGQKLFGADGEPSEYTANVLKFMQEYQAQALRTQQFCRKLKELDLLETMQAMVTRSDGVRLSLSGFMAINRMKLKALPADTVGELMQADEMEMIYAHLLSMRNFDALKDRMEQASPAPTVKGNGSAPLLN